MVNKLSPRVVGWANRKLRAAPSLFSGPRPLLPLSRRHPRRATRVKTCYFITNKSYLFAFSRLSRNVRVLGSCNPKDYNCMRRACPVHTAKKKRHSSSRPKLRRLDHGVDLQGHSFQQNTGWEGFNCEDHRGTLLIRSHCFRIGSKRQGGEAEDEETRQAFFVRH